MRPTARPSSAEGFLWNCRFGGRCIVRLSPDGEIDRIVEMPVSNITNCDFGGPDLQTLYVTTAALETGAGKSPLAGSLFADVRTEVRACSSNGLSRLTS